MFRVVSVLVVALLASTASAEPVDRAMAGRILEAGMQHGEVLEIAQHLTDRIGGRMTNSPQMREAERWTQSKFRQWGLKNVTAEPFDFGRGWSIERSSLRMVGPRALSLRAIPVAWTPPSNGAISAPVMLAPLESEQDFAAWKGKLKGRIVLISRPVAAEDPTEPAFKRLSDGELAALDVYQPPHPGVNEAQGFLDYLALNAKIDAFLAEEGALAWARMSRRDGGALHGDGYAHKVGQTPKLPGVEIAAEDYRRIARLERSGAPVTLELISDVRFHDEDPNAYNILADLPGRDSKAGYVMAGAHLDSWVAGDGAADNAAGVAVVMEAARILSSLGVRPRRTIRFALWAGEEQGVYGSRDYVERRIALRGPAGDADPLRNSFGVWERKFPIVKKPGYEDLAAYFNLDGGSGKIRGVHAEGNLAVVPIFRAWLEPFASLGASTVAVQGAGATDHVYMQAVGLPAFEFIQDPLDYLGRIHHTDSDTFDHLKGDDLRQAAVIMAAFLWFAAERDEPLPRRPLPTSPRPAPAFAAE